ncbi:MAG: asparagine synthase (glutamine-hydrolyzing) [Candidatus Brocadiae bacterium]|nr:asparagine synthase (glutamine-hydrolyzing) [Candidatus Brocadiia bacterium]
MCGICGIVHRDPAQAVSRDRLTRMIDALRHRGPDDAGTYVRGDQPDHAPGDGSSPRNAGLGMARLSIIDVLGGHQPMPNEDGSVWAVCNGEIYNFRELRDGLIARGHYFRTRSDTEVIPHLYEEHGEGCLGRLRGMFALALWDDRGGRLLLARDRLGQKPLVYHDDGSRILFASELQALVDAPDVSRELDPEALDLYLTYQYVPAPLTIYQGIRKLLPAHFLSVSAEETRLERYWELPQQTDSDLSVDDAASALREQMTEAVRMRLISDVPLGAFLSGGIDSSIVVGLMAQETKAPVRTFSIGFGERKYDELDYARIAARKFGTDHREFQVEPDAIDLLPQLVRHYGEPFADSSAIPTWYLSQRTREHVTVALSGDGGDEAFAGYQRYLAMWAGSLYDGVPQIARSAWEGLADTLVPLIPSSSRPKTVGRRIRRFLEGLPHPQAERYVNWIAYFGREHKQGLYTDAFAARLPDRQAEAYLADEFARVAELDPVAATSLVDAVTYLPNDILVKVDIASMANSLEVRSPFLDHEVMALAFSLPTSLKLGTFGTSLKWLLRRAFADLLPDAIRRRGKMGFGVPIAHWLRGDLRGYLEDHLLSPDSLARGYFQPDAVRRLVAEHLDGTADHASRLWALLNFELWHRAFLS